MTTPAFADRRFAYSNERPLPIFLGVTHVGFPWRPLGELLVERGFVIPSELEAALAEQERTGRKLGEILVASGTVTASQLTRVLVEQTGLRLEAPKAESAPPDTPLEQGLTGDSEPWRPLGRVLVDRSALAEAELEEALHVQRESGRRLGEILVQRGYVSSQALVSAVIEQHGLAEAEPAASVVATPLSTSSEETYQVEDHGSEEAKVVFRTDAFLDAVDFAFEYLEAESPERLRIFRILGRKREEVWTYGPEAVAETEEQPRDLLEVYGYDVMRWRGPAAESAHAHVGRPARAVSARLASRPSFEYGSNKRLRARLRRGLSGRC